MFRKIIFARRRHSLNCRSAKIIMKAGLAWPNSPSKRTENVHLGIIVNYMYNSVLYTQCSVIIDIFSHGWSCRSVGVQTLDFPEMINIRLNSLLHLRPNRRTFLMSPLPYLGLGNTSSITFYNIAIEFNVVGVRFIPRIPKKWIMAYFYKPGRCHYDLFVERFFSIKYY